MGDFEHCLACKTSKELSKIVDMFECLLCFDVWLNCPTFWQLDDHLTLIQIFPPIKMLCDTSNHNPRRKNRSCVLNHSVECNHNCAFHDFFSEQVNFDCHFGKSILYNADAKGLETHKSSPSDRLKLTSGAPITFKLGKWDGL